MVNNTPNNEGICFIECENQISNNYSSLNTHFKTLQNPFTNLKNYNQGRYDEKNNVDATTLPMVPFSFTNNNPTPFITTARYDRTLPLSSCNTSLTPYPPNVYRNSKDYATGYQKNFRYSPYSEASNHINNSILSNNFISRSRIDLNSYQGFKNIAIPNSNPHLLRPIKSKDLDLFFSSRIGNANSTMEHQVFDIRETEAWKNSMTQNKDDKNTIPVIKNGVANENDEKHLDLSLHL
ncbi:uncharacterized protein LOC127121079 [Lathyrus oleraceus]|uniref:uncharacterized protein LOC127121079 n=1 Tax=Pisum sativum TaxID=3888 RepID=UPI0021D22ECD|nr:uncharacterized protein LOC127121079 [Pisum sativum]